MVSPLEIDKIKGMSVEDAGKHLRTLSYGMRITSRDGEHYIVTCDYRTDRVNVAVVDDKIIGWSIG